jgi:hypothetical protein
MTDLSTTNKLQAKVVDASIHPCCWVLALPLHCGFCPYRTSKKFVSCMNEASTAIDRASFPQSLTHNQQHHPCYSHSVVRLEDEQIIRSDTGICTSSTLYRSYASLASTSAKVPIQQSQCFGCWTCVDSEIGTLAAGWACDEGWTKKMADDMRQRAQAYSHPNQILLSDQVAVKSEQVRLKMDAMEEYLQANPQVMSMTER